MPRGDPSGPLRSSASGSDKETAVSADGEAQWEARGRRCPASLSAKNAVRSHYYLRFGVGGGFSPGSASRIVRGAVVMRPGSDWGLEILNSLAIIASAFSLKISLWSRMISFGT